MKTRDITLIAVMAAFLCVAGPLTVPVGPIPLSLATFAVYLAGAVLGWKRGAAAVALYLLIGITGMPVFSGFSGGFQKLAGVTGGYLVGYLFCAAITGLGVGDPREQRKFSVPMSVVRMVAGTAVLYAFGTAWFVIQTGKTFGAALGLCVLPFLPGDTVKIIASSLISPPVRKAIKNSAVS